jgi:VIT1/CCC1 family predicted Fe2+/Mn2+ transporter
MPDRPVAAPAAPAALAALAATAADAAAAPAPRAETVETPGRGRAAALIRDVILGGQDGLVNVLGLVLGLAVATGDPRVVVTAALAAMFAESIAMAGVAYTASGAERELTVRTALRLDAELVERADRRRRERLAGADPHAADALSAVALAAADEEAAAWRTELERWRSEMAPVRETRPVRAAAVVGVATVVGSAVPLVPFLLAPMSIAPWIALVAAAVVLGIAGAERARLTGGSPSRAGVEMVLIGLASAFAGYLIGQVLRAPGA